METSKYSNGPTVGKSSSKLLSYKVGSCSSQINGGGNSKKSESINMGCLFSLHGEGGGVCGSKFLSIFIVSFPMGKESQISL